ncbi:MAG: thioredoxin family protein [Verrucomicrobia bacterium]|nr:thioredoxin family protein [Verrucomicrobiota bacterium]MDA1087246.1 thioredoxin family protein [Verrucomicrobiota bacterium]
MKTRRQSPPISTLLPVLLICTASAVLAQTEAGPLKHPHKVRLEGAAAGEWTMDYDAALKAAAENGNPIILDFTGSDWCGYCIQMQKQIFSSETWQEFAAGNLNMVTIDFPSDESIVPKKFRERNELLRDRFGIKGFPTYIFLEPDGKTVIGQEGADPQADPAGYVRKIRALLRRSQSAIEKTAAALPKEQGDTYRQQVKELITTQAALDAWLAAGPTRSDENEIKFNAFVSTLQELEASTGSLAVRARLLSIAGEDSDAYMVLFDKAKRLNKMADAASEHTTSAENWLLTSNPEASDENRKRLDALMKSVQEAISAVESL